MGKKSSKKFIKKNRPYEVRRSADVEDPPHRRRVSFIQGALKK